MKWSISSMLMSATVVGMLCIPRAAAASGSIDASVGRITFTGAVVEPTCVPSIAAGAVMQAGHGAKQDRFECSGTQMAANSGQVYSLTIVNIDAATIGRDRVLAYFVGYLQPSERAAAKLVTQTYQ